MPNRALWAAPPAMKGAILLGDAWNTRHPLTGYFLFTPSQLVSSASSSRLSARTLPLHHAPMLSFLFVFVEVG